MGLAIRRTISDDYRVELHEISLYLLFSLITRIINYRSLMADKKQVYIHELWIADFLLV